MSLELTLLLWAVALTVIQMVVAATGMALQLGVPTLVGNRDRLPPLTGWVGRAQRAHRNMLENLVLFAALVLITEITNKNDFLTGLGAQIFFWARVAYAIVYVAGVPWLRTAAWTASMAGLVLIFIELPLI
jgi:uncharacterized MAPEG superfamily protein